MRVSNKVRYGIRAVFDLAFHGCLDGSKTVQGKELARRQSIPIRFLEQILIDLRRAQIVGSKRGPSGGYYLLKPPSALTPRELAETLEGPIEFSSPDTYEDLVLVTESLFEDLATGVRELFASVTFEELCDKARDRGITNRAPRGYSYSI